MNPLDKLLGILGRDCNGKPLRKGDLVESVNPPCDLLLETRGILKVLGKNPRFPDRLSVEARNGETRYAAPKYLRKIEGGGWAGAAEASCWKLRIIEKENRVSV